MLMLLCVKPVTAISHQRILIQTQLQASVQQCSTESDLRKKSATSSTASASITAPTTTVNLTAVPYQGRIAQLSWTCLPAPVNGSFLVERQVMGASAWTLVSQLPFAVLNYSDTIMSPYCSGTDFLYRVCYVSTVPDTVCSNEPLLSQLFDQTNPPNVQNMNVGINSMGYPEITWSSLSGKDIAGFIIARNNSYGSGWPNIDTVLAGTTAYIDFKAGGRCDTIYKYVILTLDNCNRNSAPDYGLFVQTVILTLPQINPCERAAKLSWNPCLRIPGGLAGYKIYRTIDTGSPVEIADITATSYNDNYAFQNGKTYHYFVKAYSLDGVTTSSSCQLPRLFFGPNSPDSIYLSQASVVADNHVEIKYHTSPLHTVKKVILERSEFSSVRFQAIDSVWTLQGYLPSDNVFNDTTADTHNRSYYYRLIALDSCENIKIYSNLGRTILLKCQDQKVQNALDWNSYEAWLEGINGYKILRWVDGQPMGGDSLGYEIGTSFTDPLTAVGANQLVCYQVNAYENPDNPYLNKAISQSNTCCVTKDGTLFMPNAFRPDGINKLFRPVASFIDPQDFKMTIFNRFSQEIFTTTNLYLGWNGQIEGKNAPVGLYVYLITYRPLLGKESTFRGTFFLVR